MANKKFKDIIKPGMEVCIGAIDGSNYMFIGPYDEAEVTELFELYYAQEELNIPLCLRRFKACKEALDKLDPEKDLDNGYITTLRTMMGKYNTYYNTTKYVEHYRPLLEREVVEIRDRITDDRKIIMVKGSEKGKYWTREEYLSDPKRGQIVDEDEETE